MKILNIDPHPFSTVAYLNAGKGGLPERTYLPVFRGIVDRLPEGLAALIVTSDLQGREDGPDDRLLGLLLAEHLEALEQDGQVPKAEATGVILAGDLYGVPGSTKRGGGGDVTEVWLAFAERFRWVSGVLGNHDHIDPEKLPDNVFLLDGETVVLDDLEIGGLSGIIGDPNRPNRRTASDFAEMIELLSAEKPDILVLHQGPDRRPNPDPTVEQALQSGQDLFVVCGHAPWQTPLLMLSDNNQVLNVDARVVILLPGPVGGDDSGCIGGDASCPAHPKS